MTSIKSILLSLRSTGLSNAVRIIRYSLRKKQLDRLYLRSRPKIASQTVGDLKQEQLIDNGGTFIFENAALEISFLTEDLVRVTWGPGAKPVPYSILPRDWPPPALKITQQGDRWLFSTSQLSVQLLPAGSIKYYNPQGDLLRHEHPPIKSGPEWELASHLQPNENIYGLGVQSGPFDLRQGPSIRQLWNTDAGGNYGPGADPIYMPIPVYYATNDRGSYLAFHENHYRGSMEFKRSGGMEFPDRLSARFQGGLLRTYIIPGPPARAVERYTELTGRASLPPLWSLGYHQCRWGYYNGEIVREVVAGFKKHQMPLQAVHLDIDYMDGFRVFTVDEQRFPNLAELAAELDAQGVKLVTIIDPGVKQEQVYDVYLQGLALNAFITLPGGKPLAGLVWPNWSVFPDFTRADVRGWWGQYYKRLTDAGVAGIWHDMNEPVSFAAGCDLTLPLSAVQDLEGQPGDHNAGHNLYAMQMNRSAAESLTSLRPDRRPWIISRSGWAGGQRYAWNWTGDTESTWAGLKMTIATVLGLGLSGYPFTGPDIGGFSGSPDAELYVRWFQMAAFMPFFRTHSSIGTARREPWVYGEPYTTIIRNFIEFRQRLMPYLYTLAWEAAQTGHPLVRPLFWQHPDIADLRSIDDEFLLGDQLLVAPVIEPGASYRSVYLPLGGWYDYWTGLPFSDTGKIQCSTQLEEIPVFIKSGSLLPLKLGEILELHVYPRVGQAPTESNSVLQLYSDGGDGYGENRIDRFSMVEKSSIITINWESTGPYNFPYKEVNTIIHGESPRQAKLDGKLVHREGSSIMTARFHTLELEG